MVDGQITPMISIENFVSWLQGDKDPSKDYDQKTIDRLAKFLDKQCKDAMKDVHRNIKEVHDLPEQDEE